ncbi:mucin-1 [Ictalurus punctatus]|uniref:Mucin-1 n=1 Tax=Ictalurus punctatus TaxID=7998 RepID=A0A979EZJ6_ICTPU|nr:mucin-1 [Ictalurus punctatus]
MCVINKEMSLYCITGLLMLWSGVITAGNVTEAPGVGTTTSNEISAFIISIKITNRIYNDSLEDHQSHYYKILRQEVENMFFEMYKFTPSAQYQEIAEMTFSNGSVIANSIVLFGTKQISGKTIKNIFITNYQHYPATLLHLNINHTADQEPIPVLSNISPSIASMTTSITSPKLSDHTSGNESSTASTSSALTSSGSEESTNNITDTAASTQTHSNTNDIL